MMTSINTSRHTAKEWDEVRAAFASSILVDTSLSSLAQNLEGADWPLKGTGETPAGYIDLTFDEVRERLALCGQPPRMADHLIEILKETLSFDSPFGDMVTQGEQAAERENPLVKNLEKLGIPGDFPITLTALDPETLSFCRLEGVATLREFAVLAQRMAQSIIVGGDFLSLLKALSHVDEQVLARHLPYRPGERGLHYIEALAHAVRAQPVSVQTVMRKKLNYPLSEADRTLAARVTGGQLHYAHEALKERQAVLGAHFYEECRQLEQRIIGGEEIRRMVAVLNAPETEVIVADLLESLLTPAVPSAPKAQGRFGRLMKRWGF